MLKHQIGQTKIVAPGKPQLASKVITVYTFCGGPKNDWGSFLKDVESAFREHKIVPGEEVHEHRVKGSNYIYYRNDEGKDGQYVPDEYHFLYRVVDKIPLSDELKLKYSDELKGDEKAVGCILKLKDSDACFLQLKTDSSWQLQEFNVSQLMDVAELDRSQLVVISPISNRAAYLELVVPQLNKGIPSTDNTTGADDPIVNVDLTASMKNDSSETMKFA